MSYSPFKWDEINLKLLKKKKGTFHIDLARSMVDCDWERIISTNDLIKKL